MDPSPTIAIVGRPNVGKSTLFNRLIGKRYAVIAEEAGTTRDRISHKVDIDDYEILLVDTGGIQHGAQENIEEDVQTQAKIAIEEADVTIFVINSMQDMTVDDFAAADILRKSKKPIILVANKCDNPGMEANIYNTYELGFGEPIAISAIHKIGMENLQNEILKTIKKLKFKKPTKSKANIKKKITNICLLGRPNAGKSSLINALIDDPQKLIVSEIPGTTRDSTDTELIYKDNKYNLIDTAGIRRPGKISRGIEKFSVLRGFQSIERSDVVVLLIDGNERIASQDCSIASHALEAEKGLIIAVNKIDLLESGEEHRERLLRILKKKFPFVPWAPVVFISAKNKKNTYEILNISDQIMKEREKRIQTAELNSFLQKITFKHKPASTKIKKPKFMYASQVDINPPKFVLFFKNASVLHFSYPRYLENNIRAEYGFNGTPIHLKIRGKAEEEQKD
ncbi:MAG: ribosome biogenesis GTPase Der [Nitrospirae bacterium]|nr:ribosome biogenesis GTPase Der [Nitrospirota bacterium]